jgi:hypothetical protein
MNVSRLQREGKVKMLPNLANLEEQTPPAQPVSVLVGLSFEEDRLLTELGDQARDLVPSLGDELIDLIQHCTSPLLFFEVNETDLRLYLQDWFLQLFQTRDEAFLQSKKPFQRIHLHLILSGIDLILAYGNAITQCSDNPKGATKAFHKALALKIASEQLQSQVDTAEHLYNMMLLD